MEAIYVALDADRFEQRFLDYPRDIDSKDVQRIRNAAVEGGDSWVEEPVGYYLKVLPSAGEGQHRIDGAEGWQFAVADLLATCEVDRWRSEHGRSLLEVFTETSFSQVFERALREKEWAAWRLLASTLASDRDELMTASPQWWRRAMAKDGTFAHGLISPAEREQIVEEMVGRDLVSRFVEQVRDHCGVERAEELDHLVQWLSSETSGRWVFAWVPTE